MTNAHAITRMLSIALIAVLLAACGVGAPGGADPGDGGPVDDGPIHGEPGDGGPGDGDPGDGGGPLSAALALVNSFRAEPRYCGPTWHPAAPSLTIDTRLNAAAQAHSDYMAINKHFSHFWTDGTNPGHRVAAQGYSPSTVGENIAMGPSSSEQAIHRWFNSDGHCRNVMNPSFVHMGLASATAADGRQYWTQVFAAPR